MTGHRLPGVRAPHGRCTSASIWWDTRQSCLSKSSPREILTSNDVWAYPVARIWTQLTPGFAVCLTILLGVAHATQPASRSQPRRHTTKRLYPIGKSMDGLVVAPYVTSIVERSRRAAGSRRRVAAYRCNVGKPHQKAQKPDSMWSAPTP
jgi:hypothetical protein